MAEKLYEVTVGLGFAGSIKKLVPHPPEQKYKVGQVVYIRPIMNVSKHHFNNDMITKVSGTYGQIYDGNSFKEYSLEIASWYDEEDIMPCDGMTLEECREACKDFFGMSYQEMVNKRKENYEGSIFHRLEKILEEDFKNAIEEIDRRLKDETKN